MKESHKLVKKSEINTQTSGKMWKTCEKMSKKVTN